MSTASDANSQNDPFNLRRFQSAQATSYETALKELRDGKKRSHWMWYIFPQIDGLGFSAISKQYAIKSKAEAQQYLAHPSLGARLRKCAEAVLEVKGRSALEIFGSPDDMKLKSSMTLFEAVASPESVFTHVLKAYFRGERDSRTLDLLDRHK